MARRSGSGRGWVRWLVGVVVVIVVVIIAAIVIAPMVIPVDTIRDKIVAAAKDATGRDLQIKGGLSLSIFPTIAVTAKDVSFSNASWAGDKPMVSLESLDVRLSLLPLLSQRIEISSFVLQKPYIDLQTDKNGHGNWEFATPAAAGTTPAKPAASASGGSAPSGGSTSGGGAGIGEIALGDVRITDGHISYKNGVTGKTETADAINLKIALPDLDSPLALDGSVHWHDKEVQLTLAAAKPRGLLDGSGSAVKLNLAADPIKLGFDGTLVVAGAPKGSGDVDLSVASIRNLVAWSTGQPLAAPGDGLGPLSLKGKVTVDGTKYGLNGVQLALDQIKGTADLAVDTGGARPSVKGKLAVDKLDLNHYMAPADAKTAPAAASDSGAGKTGGAGKSAAPAQGWSDEPIDASGLKAANINLALEADAIVYRKVEIGKTGVQITLDGGRLTLDLTDMALYQGAVKGRVQVDGSGTVLGTDANLKIDKVQVGPLLKALADTDRVSGLAVADTTLNSKGRSQKELVGALSGKGSLALQNGVVKGIDLVGMIKNAAASVVGANGGDTAFTSATGTYTIAAGILSNKDLNVSAPTLSTTGAGTVDLPRRTVDYKLSAKLASTVAVPINVKGPWDSISWNVDLAGMVTQNVGNAGKLLGSGAKGATDVLGGVGKKLFGN